MDESFRRRGHRSCEAKRGFRSFGTLLLRYAFELVGSKQKLGGGEGPGRPLDEEVLPLGKRIRSEGR